jgi:hypothetical protein
MFEPRLPDSPESVHDLFVKFVNESNLELVVGLY